MKTNLLCGLVAAALLGQLAHASEIISFIGTTGFLATGNTPRSLQVQGFDPSLGLLTGVKLTYAGEVVQTRKVENTGGITPFNYTLSGAANLSLAKASGGPALFSTPADAFTFSQSGTINFVWDGATDYAGNSGVTLVRDTTWNSPAPYLDSDLASYLTTGLINFTSLATATGGAAITAGSGSSLSLNKAAATLQVEYTYTQIPEPATYAAGLGLAALGAAAWRRRARQPA